MIGPCRSFGPDLGGLRIAPPPRTTNGPLAETQARYVERIGVERWTGWRFLCVNDPGLRSYVDGGEWL